MDKEQAIDLLDNLIGMVEDNQENDYDTAFRMAIEALKQPEIVRCGECEHFRKEHDGEMWCGVSKGHGIDEDFFCGDAERKTDG